MLRWKWYLKHYNFCVYDLDYSKYLKELKSLLMWKRRVKKAGLELNIQKTKIMASSTITSWQIDGETMETVRDFVFLGSKITVNSDCSHEIKRLLGRKAMTKVDSMLKIRDITLPTKVHLVKASVFPVVMSGCESWTIKKAEHQRTDAFELWFCRRLLRVPWTVRDPTSLSWRKLVLNTLWKDWYWTETPILWPPDAKNWLTGKDPDAGKWRREEKGMTEDEMVGWHHWRDRHESE